MSAWDHRKWGTLDDPIHKSDTTNILGDFGCGEKHRRSKIREALGEARETIGVKTALGTAAHESIDAGLEKLPFGTTPTEQATRAAIEREYALAIEGMEVIDAHLAPKLITERVHMVRGAIRSVFERATSIMMVEPGFIAPLGKYYIEGHIDVVYESLAGGIGTTDWKTGATKPDQISLDHGYEAGFYAHALQHGLFVTKEALARWRAACRGETSEIIDIDAPAALTLASNADHRTAMHAALRSVQRRVERGDPIPEDVRFVGEFPSEIHLGYLADFVPYARKGTKEVKRPEELAFYGVNEPCKVSYEAGQARGPGWYEVKRYPGDVARLEYMLRKLVASVRMGVFVPDVGSKCGWCSFKGDCLTSGYELDKNEARAVSTGLEYDGFGEAEVL